VIINRVERDSKPVWTARSAGAKPAKLDERFWLAEVVDVIDGTGVPREERAWWTEVGLHRLPVCKSTARFGAEEAARAWYEETDQNGGECAVAMRVTAWTGDAWLVVVPLKWELKVKAAIVKAEKEKA